MSNRAALVALLLILSTGIAAEAQTVVGDRIRIGDAATTLDVDGSTKTFTVTPSAPILRGDSAIFRQRAPGATKYVSEWFVDSQTGATVWNSYDTTGNVYTPSILRALSLSIEAPTSITGTLAVSSNTNVSGYVGHPDFTSQVSKWRVTNEGAADFRYLYTDELHAKAFIADLEQALAGGQIISKSVAVLAEDFRCPATPGLATLVVEDLPGAPDMQVFEANDFVVVRSFSRAGGGLTIADCVGTVESPNTTANGTQSWVFRRGATNAGTMAEGGIAAKKGLALDFGISGNGYYEVNAIDGAYGANSPYAQIVTWTTAPTAANRTVRARFGKLTGITSVANEYGMIAGDYAATNGRYFRASNEAFELHGIDLSIWDGASMVIKLDRLARSFALGATAPTGYSAGTGVWMGNDAGTYKFRVGVPGGQGVFWDGLTLTVNGAINVSEGGTIGGWRVLTSSLADLAGVVGMSSAVTGGDDIRFFAGHATPSSAPFRVTEAGVLTAASGTVGGWTLGASTLTGGNATLASSGNLTLGTGNDVARLSADDATYRLWIGNATAGSAPFRVTTGGAVTATSGTIGGWTLGATALTSGSGASRVGLDSGGSNPAFYAGSETPGSAPFRVTPAGAVTATNATITGAITATSGSFTGSITSSSGTIGGWTLGATSLTSGSGVNTRGVDSGGTNPAFYAGSATPASAPFRVTAAGALTATNADMTGSLSAGSGAVTINSNGITITAGAGTEDQIKWSDGSHIESSTGTLNVEAGGGNLTLEGNGITLNAGTDVILVLDHIVPNTNNSQDLGTSTVSFRDLFLSRAARVGNLTGTGTRAVCVESDGDLVVCP
jgi:hypothetical protein